MKEINVEEIMAEIRQDIKDKGYNPDMLSFVDIDAYSMEDIVFNPDELRTAVTHVQANRNVPWKLDNLGGGIKGFAKKVVRKLIGFVIAPLSDGQNMYNQQVATALCQLLGYVEQQNSLVEEYEERILMLEKKIEKMEK